MENENPYVTSVTGVICALMRNRRINVSLVLPQADASIVMPSQSSDPNGTPTVFDATVF
jgi:hypothetical protein